MGPMEALAHLAQGLGIGNGIETLTCSERFPLVAMDLQEASDPEFRLLDEGVTVRGFPNFHRTSNVCTRPFRDDVKNTLTEGRHKVRYSDVVQKMLENHPEDKGLQAFHRALLVHFDLPAWIKAKNNKDKKKDMVLVPFFEGKPVFDTVAPDLEGGNPYWETINGKAEGHHPRQNDIVTGKPCVVSKRPPIRIVGIGVATGVTLMSTNDETTMTRGLRIDTDSHLRVPISDETMDQHAAGMQWLIDQQRHVPVYGQARTDGGVYYYAWTASRKEGVDQLLLDILRKRVPLSEIEERAAALRTVEDNLCVLGVTFGKRLQYVGWHYLPAQEALDNILAYARARHREDGTVLNIRDVVRSCANFERGVSESVYSYADHFKAGEQQCLPPALFALMDHVVEGLPFPRQINQHVRFAYASQSQTDLESGQYHLQNQEALLE